MLGMSLDPHPDSGGTGAVIAGAGCPSISEAMGLGVRIIFLAGTGENCPSQTFGLWVAHTVAVGRW